MIDKRLLREVIKDKAYIRLVVMNGLFSFITSLLQSLFTAIIVNNIFMRHEAFIDQIPLMVSLLLLIPFRSIFQYQLEKRLRTAGLKVKISLQKRAIKAMLLRENEIVNTESSGSKMMAVCEAAESIDVYFYDYLPQLFAVAVSVPLILVTVAIQDIGSFFIMLFTAPLLPFFLALIGMASAKLNANKLKTLQNLGGSFLDTLNGLRTLKLFGQNKTQSSKIYKVSEAFRKTTMEVLRVSFLSAFVLELVATISTAVIAVSLGLRLIYGNMQFFQAFLILLLAPEYYMPIRQLGAKFHTSMSAKAAADKIYSLISVEVIDEKPEQKLEVSDITSGADIVFNNVWFSYDKSNIPALQGVKLNIPHNKITALVGKSGSGKSTIAASLLRFIEIDSGNILINNQNIKDISKGTLRSIISYIPQKPFIFRDTVFENIRFSKPEASLSEVIEAAKLAAADEFIRQLPNGYDTVLSEEGKSISHGQAQRIAIARAILKDSPIVVMDEVTSGLDDDNQAFLNESITNLSKNRTLLIIAHRLETIVAADCIYVIDNGIVCESGSHKELIDKNGVYKELFDVWERNDCQLETAF